MTEKEFIMWLKGFLDSRDNLDESLTKIKNKLKEVGLATMRNDDEFAKIWKDAKEKERENQTYPISPGLPQPWEYPNPFKPKPYQNPITCGIRNEMSQAYMSC